MALRSAPRVSRRGPQPQPPRAWFGLGRGGGGGGGAQRAPAPPPVVRVPVAVASVCSSAWDVSLSLYERSPREDGPITRREAARASRVETAFSVSFDPPPPPRAAEGGPTPRAGLARVVRPSRFFRAGEAQTEGRARWRCQPGEWHFSVTCDDALVVGGGLEVLPAGIVYFNAKIIAPDDTEGGAVTLEDGVATVRRNLPGGLFSEYVICGRFTATRRSDPVEALAPR